MSKRIAFVISWVAEDVDSTVGGLPTVAIMKNNNPQVEYLKDETAKEIENQVKQLKPELPKKLGFGEETGPTA